METFWLVFWCVAVVFIVYLVYLIPIHIAKVRNHSNQQGVRLLALLGIVLPFLWLVAVAYACIGTASPKPLVPVNPLPNTPTSTITSGTVRKDYSK